MYKIFFQRTEREQTLPSCLDVVRTIFITRPAAYFTNTYPRVYHRSLAGLGVRVPTPSQQAPATSPSLAEHSLHPAPSRLSELKAGRGRMFLSLSPIIWQGAG